MNFSENGKEPIEYIPLADARKRQAGMKARFRKKSLQILIFGLLAGFLFGVVVCRAITEKAHTEAPASPAAPIQHEAQVVIPVPLPEAELIAASTPFQPFEITSERKVSLGTYRITAYCFCEICCGEWAKNRPNGIVYGAAGVELKPGVSCASTLPFGTALEIDGIGERVVQDRTSQWVIDLYGENLIDLYFDDHQAALNFGVKYLEVYEKEVNP